MAIPGQYVYPTPAQLMALGPVYKHNDLTLSNLSLRDSIDPGYAYDLFDLIL
jgi:hypothetical protein